MEKRGYDIKGNGILGWQLVMGNPYEDRRTFDFVVDLGHWRFLCYDGT